MQIEETVPAVALREDSPHPAARSTPPRVLPQHTRPQRNLPRSERAVDFEPLGYAGDLSPMESGQIVRVSLTLGDGSEASVQADVLVGEDGVAQAIRFVK